MSISACISGRVPAWATRRLTGDECGDDEQDGEDDEEDGVDGVHLVAPQGHIDVVELDVDG